MDAKLNFAHRTASVHICEKPWTDLANNMQMRHAEKVSLLHTGCPRLFRFY